MSWQNNGKLIRDLTNIVMSNGNTVNDSQCDFQETNMISFFKITSFTDTEKDIEKSRTYD